ncbi:translocation/assembly module TamB domain-containing protein [Pseudomonas sp. GCM10022188]|uniref:translocation/assembly module TamB domain-containing protein n=1 Tax=Pseudomonas TaxID=286 RepID=UPI001E349952|nr:translocation/assembly module TamB domain-containing protein [Pseudomonas oryzagri]MCC6077430.1 translocation/assembly module TamB [Pseudomonas oryzagri]
MRRRLRLGLLALLLLAPLGLLVLPASESGSRWLLARMPGLVVEDFRGRLLGNWSAARLRWQSGASRVELEQLRVVNRLACLRTGTLCLDEVSAARLRLDLPPSTEPQPAEPLALPEIRLPLAVRIQRLQLGSLVVNDVEQLRGLVLAADLDRHGLRLSAVELQRDGMRLAVSELNLLPHGDWPLHARARLDLPPVEGQAWQLDLTLDGPLRQRLALEAHSQGYLPGRLSGWLSPLARDLPLALELQVGDFLARADLPPSLRIASLALRASGTLREGWAVDGQASLAGRDRSVAVELRGALTTTGARIKPLRLVDGKGERLELAGTLDWRAGLVARLGLQGGAFDWQQLYPQPAVNMQLNKVQAAFSYAEQRYEGDVDLQLNGPAGPLRLSTPVQGDAGRVELPALRLEAGKGRAEGELTVEFAGALAWQTQLRLSDLDPAYWHAAFPGRIGGELASQGQLQGGQLNVNADWALDGELRRQPLAFKGRLSGEGAHWQVPELDLRLGDNRVDGQGEWNRKLSGGLRLALPRLDQLWPGLRGALEGTLALAGTAQAPQGSLVLRGQRLAYAEQELATLRLDANLDARQRGELHLTADGLRRGDSDYGQLELRGAGTRENHSFDFELAGKPLQLDLALAGGLRGRAWRGSLNRGEVGVAGLDWRLQQPVSLERTAAGRVTLGAHCWASERASLCADAQRLQPEPQLRMRLRDFDLARLARLLPDGFALVGQLNGDLRLDLPAGGPRGEINLDAGSGQLRLRDPHDAEGDWQTIPYQALRLTSRLQPKRIDSELRVAGPGLGSLTLQASIDPLPATRPLTGSFRIDGLDLGLARPFVPQVERIEGRIDGSGRLSGSLLAPVVDGRLALRNGRLGGGELPLSFEALQLAMTIAGQQAQLEGSWRSGEQGQGSLTGSLDWSAAPQMDVKIRGQRLPVVVEPYANVEVDPDLEIGLRDRQLSIGGQVAIPRGQIKVRELPPQAVKVSKDAQIVGEQPRETGMAGLKMNLSLLIGEERLRFAGFGLTADLKGNLRIRDNLDSRGTLQLENGRYRAYGQRLTLRRARLIFAGPIEQPLLDIEAIRTVDEVVAGLRLTGRADAPISEVFSEPAMSQEQALSYLVLGRAPDTSGEQSMVSQAALALGLAGGAPVAGALAERLGIKDFLLDTEESGGDSSVVASGYLSDRLSLRYGVGMFETGNVVALRYELSKKLYLEAASGLASSLDIFYKKDF